MMQKYILDMPKMIPRWPKINKLTAAPLHKIYKNVIEGNYQDAPKIAQRLNIESCMVVLV